MKMKTSILTSPEARQAYKLLVNNLGNEDSANRLLEEMHRHSNDGLVRRTFGFERRAPAQVDEQERKIRMVFSSEALDSYNESVRQDWGKRIARFENNPVILWAHNRFGFFGMDARAAEVFPIGFGSNWKFARAGSEMDITFVDERANPMAEQVYQGVLQGSIRASSVGFVPHKVIDERDEDGWLISRELMDNELFEVSMVPIPANFEAVAKSLLGGEPEQGTPRYEEHQRLGQKAIQVTRSKSGRLLEARAPGGELLEKGAVRMSTDSAKAHHTFGEGTPFEVTLSDNSGPAKAHVQVSKSLGVRAPEPQTKRSLTMDEKEALIEAKADNKVLKAENERLKERAAEADKRGEEARDKAEKAEARCKELEANQAELEKAKAELEKAKAELEEKNLELENELGQAVVDSYIGTKATPAERDDLIELYVEKGAKEFKAKMKRRADLKLTSEMTSDKGDNRNTRKSALAKKMKEQRRPSAN